jgi:hypothetical protein
MRTSVAFVVLFTLLAPASYAQQVTGSDAVTAQYRDPETIERITNRLAGRARESWGTVLADGESPLTWGSVASFSLLLHECYDAQLTEAEAELIAKRLADSHARSDANGQKALANDWTQMLTTLAGSAAARTQVKTKLDARIQSAAASKTGWALAVKEALDRRNRQLQKSTQSRPEWATATGYDASMSVADLDASIEMLYFMWVAAGRDPELVTLEGVAMIRAIFLQNFAQLPADLQYALANAQKIYAGLRVLWYTGDRNQRTQLARYFSQQLDRLGLPDPNGGSSASSSSGSDAHAAFAADMVVGLAGSSYKSAW